MCETANYKYLFFKTHLLRYELNYLNETALETFSKANS
jgi:hypothetical protein